MLADAPHTPPAIIRPTPDNPHPWGAFYVQQGDKKILLYAPNSQQQADFHASTIPNLILTGSRGGGKSTCMRFDAHMRCRATPGFKALILRREMPDLRKTHLLYIKREAKLLGADYNKAEFTVTYKHYDAEGNELADSVLVFGHCEDDGAIAKYLSSEWDAIYFDEVVTFEKKQFLLISACARAPEESNRVAIVRGGTNPVGIGADWVYKYFIEKSVLPTEDETYNPDEWAFIQVNMDDNAHLNKKAYEKRLSALKGLSQALYKAYRYGLWVREGQFFDEWLETDPETGRPWHVLPKIPEIAINGELTPIHRIPWIEVYRSIDWGYDPDPCVVGWYACMPNGRVIKFKERVYRKTLAKDVAKDVLKESAGMKVRYTTADTQMWATDPLTGHSIADGFDENGVPLDQANKDRINGWMAVHEWLQELIDEGHGPAPKLQFVAWDETTGLGCPYTIRTIPTLVHDEKHPGDCKGSEDHAADETRYGLMSRPSASKPVTEDDMPSEVREILKYVRAREGASGLLGSEAVHN